MRDETQSGAQCPICGSISAVAADRSRTYKTTYVCNACGYKWEKEIRPVLNGDEQRENGHIGIDRLAEAIASKTGIAVLTSCFILLLFASLAAGFTFWLTFAAVWFGLVLAIGLGLLVLAYILPYIVGGAILVVVGALVYSFATGKELLGMGILGVIIGIFVYMLILSLLLLLAFVAPALVGAIAVYFALGMSTMAAIAAVIAFIGIAILTYLVLIHILLPFMIGYSICSAAGNIAYLLTTVGFSFDKIQKLVLSGQLFSNSVGLLLKPSSIGGIASIPMLILVVSILFGLSFIVLSIAGGKG
jgi:hypothetical protein